MCFYTREEKVTVNESFTVYKTVDLIKRDDSIVVSSPIYSFIWWSFHTQIGKDRGVRRSRLNVKKIWSGHYMIEEGFHVFLSPEIILTEKQLFTKIYNFLMSDELYCEIQNVAFKVPEGANLYVNYTEKTAVTNRLKITMNVAIIHDGAIYDKHLDIILYEAILKARMDGATLPPKVEKALKTWEEYY